jgi:hypothetical protein
MDCAPWWGRNFLQIGVDCASFMCNDSTSTQQRELKMKLITREIELKLKKNMALPEGEREPVVKFFGGGACTWLISEKEGDILFGLCDLGLGGAELGYVSLSELESLKFPPFGLGVERDSWFEADKTLSAYADEARELGRIAA